MAPIFVKPLATTPSGVPGFVTSFRETDTPIDIESDETITVEPTFDRPYSTTEEQADTLFMDTKTNHQVHVDVKLNTQTEEEVSHNTDIEPVGIDETAADVTLSSQNDDHQVHAEIEVKKPIDLEEDIPVDIEVPFTPEENQDSYKREEIETEIDIETEKPQKSEVSAELTVEKKDQQEQQLDEDLKVEEPQHTNIPITHLDEANAEYEKDEADLETNQLTLRDVQIQEEQVTEVTEVVVESAPVFVTTLTDITVYAKEDLVLEVVVRGNPLPTVCPTALTLVPSMCLYCVLGCVFCVFL